MCRCDYFVHVNLAFEIVVMDAITIAVTEQCKRHLDWQAELDMLDILGRVSIRVSGAHDYVCRALNLQLDTGDLVKMSVERTQRIDICVDAAATTVGLEPQLGDL